MKLGVLFSGGKDSCAATAIAQRHGHDVACLLTIQSTNKDSYMFHTPNTQWVEQQGDAMGIPVLTHETPGDKEEELTDLKELIREAVAVHDIEGVVTGAVASVYQATRVQRICHELGLWCFNPLWQRDPYAHIEQLVNEGFEIFIGAIAAYPMEEEWLGRRIGEEELVLLKKLQDEHKINPSGEGGEFETFVTHGPGWQKRIKVKEARNSYDNHAGVWEIEEVELVQQEKELGERKSFGGNSQGILLINTCTESLSEIEFVVPIANIVGDCTIKHYKEPCNPDDYDRIIICGTAIKDDDFLKGNWKWLKKYDKPILGICAGYQLLGLLEGKKLEEHATIGMQEVGQRTRLGEVKEAFFLHHNRLEKTGPVLESNNRIGILFHPEVRNEFLIENFLRQ